MSMRPARSHAAFSRLIAGVWLVIALFAGPRAAANEHTAPDAGASESSAVDVRVHDRVVFVVRAGRGDRSAVERANAASQALESSLGSGEEIPEVRVDDGPNAAVVFVDKTPIITLGDEDATLAGDVNLRVHAASVATRVQAALRTEKKRSAIATTVFSLSLLVLSGLIAFLVLRRTSDTAEKIRARIREHPEKLPAVRLGKVEVVSAAAVRGTVSIGLMLGHRLSQAALVYGWLIFALSLFDATRGYTERLTGFVLRPLSALASRVGSALPLLLVALIAALAVSVLVRFVGLFFESAAKGETTLRWLPRDLARPTSVLTRFAIVVVALTLASPLITGTDDGALSRTGVVILVALALASTPILACAMVGIAVVFGRKLTRGEYAEVGGRAGRVIDTTLLEVRLEDASGCEVRVPHLLSLLHPTRVIGQVPLSAVDVVVDPKASQKTVHELLLATARSVSSARASVELVAIDADGARYRVTAAAKDAVDGALLATLTDALAKEGVALGRGGRAAR